MRVAAFALACTLASSASVHAGEEHFGPFSVRSDRPALIYLDGDIGYDTHADFARARRAAPDATTLILNSDGGGVDQAMRIARDVRDLALDTYVPLRNNCFSACAYVFFAGVNRRAIGQLGVHQVSDPAFTAVSLQRDIADLIDLFNDFGVDPRITSRMLRTPPESMYVLDRREMVLLGANAESSASLDALDDLFGHLPGEWLADENATCQAIVGGAGWSGGCVPVEWITTSPQGAEKYFFQDADHQMGFSIVAESGEWTRDDVRDVVLDLIAEQQAEGARDIVREMTWPAAGLTFDLVVYPGWQNGADVLFQHFYAALPEGGALRILLYSAPGSAWLATSKIAQVFSDLQIDGVAQP